MRQCQAILNILHTPNDYCGVAACKKALPLLTFRRQSLQTSKHGNSFFIVATRRIIGKSAPNPSRYSGSTLYQSAVLPSPQAGESATTIAWRNALNSYRKSLSDKDFKRIMIPAGPEDVANQVETWQCRQSASRYARVAAAVRAGVGRMQRFSASIDMLAQGSPSPGCLLWGFIKFVLTVGIYFVRLHQQNLEKCFADCSHTHAAVRNFKISCA